MYLLKKILFHEEEMQCPLLSLKPVFGVASAAAIGH